MHFAMGQAMSKVLLETLGGPEITTKTTKALCGKRVRWEQSTSDWTSVTCEDCHEEFRELWLATQEIKDAN
jgi:hypothetical protein